MVFCGHNLHIGMRNDESISKYLFAKHNNEINKGIKLIFVVVPYEIYNFYINILGRLASD